MRKNRRVRNKSESTKGKVDRGLFFLTVILFLLGLLAVADASAPQALNFFGDSYFFVKQQLVWGALGFVLLIIATLTPYTFWKRVSTLIFIGNLILLVIVLIPAVGSKFLGARRWINIGPVGLQPSEFAKFSLALYLAHLSETKKTILPYIIPIAVIGALIMLQPDLGTTIVVIAVGFTQMFVSGVPLLPFAGAIGASSIMGFILIMTSGYRRERLMTFLTHSSDPLANSYHIRQVLIALGSGGIFGVGLGQGRQKYLFLPEAATDSVFAVIAEEIGFVGSFFLIALLVLFILRAFKIAKNAPDSYGTVLAVGITAWIGSQIFLNIGSMVAFLPLTGVPLPFFSYGGSSLTMILLGVGILLNISKSHAKK